MLTNNKTSLVVFTNPVTIRNIVIDNYYRSIKADIEPTHLRVRSVISYCSMTCCHTVRSAYKHTPIFVCIKYYRVRVVKEKKKKKKTPQLKGVSRFSRPALIVHVILWILLQRRR